MQQPQQRNKALFVLKCSCKPAASSKQTFFHCAHVSYREKKLQICTTYHKSKRHSTIRAYSRPLLGVTLATNLLPWVLKKIFLFEMMKNGVYLGSVRQENDNSLIKCALKK